MIPRFEPARGYWCVYCRKPWEVRIVAPPGGCLVTACRTCQREYRVACFTNKPVPSQAPEEPKGK